MTTPLDLDLDWLSALAKEATPGPWTHARLALVDGETTEQYVARCVAAGSGPFYFGFVEKHDGPADAYHTGNGPCSKANSAFIAALVNSWPAIEAELRSARAKAQAAREEAIEECAKRLDERAAACREFEGRGDACSEKLWPRSVEAESCAIAVRSLRSSAAAGSGGGEGVQRG